MTRDEIINLLSIAAAYDKRTLGEADIAAWSDAADRGRWSYDMAQDAVKAHYAERAEWLMPSHITYRIRSRRAEPPRSSALPQAPQSASNEHQQQVVQWFAERTRVDRQQHPADNRACHAIACPYCDAPANEPCRQTTGRHRPRTGTPPIDMPHTHRRDEWRARAD